MHATAKRASAWGIGAEVCMRTGHLRPSVHAQGALAPKCACTVEHNSNPKALTPKPQTLNPKPECCHAHRLGYVSLFQGNTWPEP